MNENNKVISPGDPIPNATVQIKTELGIKNVETASFFRDCRAVMFAVPGAFTPTCSAKHLPSFVENAEKLKASGFDKIVCLSVNDAHVMREWSVANKAEKIIDFLADPHMEFTRSLGIARDMGSVLGIRAARCAITITKGNVEKVFLEAPSSFDVSSAENVLLNL